MRPLPPTKKFSWFQLGNMGFKWKKVANKILPGGLWVKGRRKKRVARSRLAGIFFSSFLQTNYFSWIIKRRKPVLNNILQLFNLIWRLPYSISIKSDKHIIYITYNNTLMVYCFLLEPIFYNLKIISSEQFLEKNFSQKNLFIKFYKTSGF